MSKEKLFEEALRNAEAPYKGLLTVIKERVSGHEDLAIDVDTGECYKKGAWNDFYHKTPHSKFKSKVINAKLREKEEQRKRECLAKKNSPIIDQIKEVRSLSRSVIK